MKRSQPELKVIPGTGPTQRSIRDTSKTQPSVDPELLARQLGAKEVSHEGRTEKEDAVPRRIAYQVEKFIPTHCPNPACLHSFDRNPWLRRRQRGYLLSLFWKGSYADQAIAVLPGAIHQAELQTDLVICTQCHNHTLRVLIERRQYIKKRDARAALQNDGFVNLQPVLQTGTHAEGGDTVECFVPRR